MSEKAAFKICIFGNSGVGKTSLMHRFLTGRVNLNIKKTIGLDIGMKHLKIQNVEIILQIWDFAGEKRFRFFLPSYSRGAAGAIYMYDITRRETLLDLDDWLKVFTPFPNSPEKQVPIIMVGGKSDLKEKREVLKEIAQQVAISKNFFSFTECSSLTGEKIEEIFKILSQKIMRENNIL
ncbi:MAG: Rab family GTPase [Promethearchaeota archaeon]